jgi:cytochrome c-type biogenesis protein CcmE
MGGSWLRHRVCEHRRLHRDTAMAAQAPASTIWVAVMSYRLLVLPLLGVIAVLGGFIAYGNLNNNLVYYLTPAEAIAKRDEFSAGERFRLGGFVQENSVSRTGSGVAFTVESDGAEVAVLHAGMPSQLFGAGIGVVVEGSWGLSAFESDTLIVKHDENYRPPDARGRDSDPPRGDAP